MWYIKLTKKGSVLYLNLYGYWVDKKEPSAGYKTKQEAKIAKQVFGYSRSRGISIEK